MGGERVDLDFRLFFEQAPGRFLVLKPDPGFTILAVSEAYLGATRTRREAIVGRGIFEVFPDDPADPAATGTRNLRRSLERVVETLRPDSMAVQEYAIPLPEGGFEERHWSPYNAPVLGRDGALVAIIHRVEDVTGFVHLSRSEKEVREASQELGRENEAMRLEVLRSNRRIELANQELRRANRGLAEVDVAKTEFFSNISHEFRTPLTLILGPLEDLRTDRRLPPDVQESLGLVGRNAGRLLALVNDLLAFASLEAGRARIELRPTDLAASTAEIASGFRSAIERAGLRLVIDTPPLPRPIPVDPAMYEKILLNLLSNAFKFTLAGTITVRLHWTGAGVTLRVEDTGCGIPAAELPRVFERFHRVRGATGRSIEGTGIGLSLVAGMVQLHGGTISVESRPGQGSTFVVTLPAGPEATTGPTVEAPRGGVPVDVGSPGPQAPEPVAGLPEVEPLAMLAGSGAAPRVVLAEDNEDMRRYLVRILEAQGLRVVAAEDGQLAFQAVLAEPTDLVLSDAMMPNLDGFGLLATLRGDPRTRAIPMILLSARAGEDSAVEGLDHGADDYLAKPFSARELAARVRTHLQLSRLRKRWAGELEEANRELEAFAYSVSHDLRAPLRVVAGFVRALREELGGAPSGQVAHYLDRIQASAIRMGNLIEDLLRLAKVGRAPLVRGRVDVSALGAEIAARLREADPERPVEVAIAAGLEIQADRNLVGIALENLLSNAWKFTRGRARARIEVGGVGGELVVKDDGIGFDPARAGRLFQPFERLPSAEDFEGSGIGLAIVARIVRRHGGDIRVEAAPGQGAAFYFRFSPGVGAP